MIRIRIMTVLNWFLWLILIQGRTRAGRCPNQGCLEIPSPRYEEAREMTTLNLSSFCIESIQSGLGLQNYPNLENVYFNFRRIATIKEGSFEDMESLKTLHLSRNCLFSLSDDAFRGAENLEEIDISNNLLKLIREPFANLTHLEHLDLSHNAIKVILGHAFANSQNLTTLNLSSNNLTNGSIHNQTFCGLSSLRKLDLSNNQLYNIASGSLLNLTNLRWLSLSGNFLSEIDMSLWPRAGNLHSVFLTSNHYLTSLTNIPESIQTLDTVPVPCADKSPRQVSLCVPDEDNLVNCYNSQHCKLVGQGLTSIPPAINQEFGRPIKSLHLTDNCIGSISQASMEDYHNLIRLFLDSNLIEEIQDGAFHGMNDLTSIHLNKNHLSRLTNETFGGAEHLAKLDLSDNKLYLIKDIFANLSNLTHLHLRCNDIEHIDYGAFSHFHDLMRLDLRSNNLSKLSIWNISFGNVSEIDLSDNHLSEIPPNLFANVKNLRKLFLSGNNLTHVNMSLWQAEGLQALHLERNFYLRSVTGVPDSLLTLEAIDIPCSFDNLKALKLIKKSEDPCPDLTSPAAPTEESATMDGPKSTTGGIPRANVDGHSSAVVVVPVLNFYTIISIASFYSILLM